MDFKNKLTAFLIVLLLPLAAGAEGWYELALVRKLRISVPLDLLDAALIGLRRK